MKNQFQKNNYLVVKNVFNEDILKICCEYLELKREATFYLYNHNYIVPQTNFYGSFDDKQVSNTWSCYGDILMEVLLKRLKNNMETWTGFKLLETYAYTRIYKNGDVLHRHKDRFECEVSTTLNLGGDLWPIFLEPNKKIGKIKNDKYYPGNTKGIEIVLNPGDMLLYRGDILEHWREKFNGQSCTQVFLHYIKDIEKNKLKKFDGRPSRGLPKHFPRKYWL